MNIWLSKLNKIEIVIVVACILCGALNGINVKAASKILRKTDKTTYAIPTTSGELCSTTVSTFLTENADKKSSKKAIYNNRSACVWHEDVSTWSKIKIGISSDAYHVNGNKAVKNLHGKMKMYYIQHHRRWYMLEEIKLHAHMHLQQKFS